MTGYVRQSSADIVATAVVRANPLNTEFNTLRDAFAFHSSGTTGHKHDGSSSEGSYVPLIADLDALNKVAVDTSNNRVGVFVEVSSSAVEQLRVSDGLVTPVTDNDIDLGQSTVEFKDLYLDGTAHIDTLDVDENAAIIGTLTVTGVTALNGGLTMDSNKFTVADTSGNVATAGTLSVTGVTALDGGLTMDTDKFTVADTSGNVATAGTLAVTGTSAFTGAVTADAGVSIDNITIDGTEIDLSSGDLTVDVAGDIILDADGGDILVKDAGTTFGSLTNTSGNLIIKSGTTTAATFSGANVDFAGTVDVTGAGTFDSTVAVAGVLSPATHVDMPDNAKIKVGTGDDLNIYHDGSNSYIENATGALKIATESSGIAVTIGHSTSEVTVADNLTVAGNLTVTGTQTIVDTVTMNAENAIVFEGATADAHETTLTIVDPTADHTYKLPDLGSTADEGFIAAFAADPGSSPLVTATPTELSIMDGDTNATSTTLADADRVVVNDAGTMKQVALTDVSTYVLGNVTTVGALNSGSITSGFGTIDTGSSAITTTGTINFGSLADGTITVTGFVDEDNMSSDSATLIPTQQSVKAYVATIAGQSNNIVGLTASADELNILDDATVTTAELNILDGSATTQATVTLAATDGVVISDADVMKQCLVSDFDTFMASTTKTLTNKTLTSPTLNGTIVVSDGSNDFNIASHDGSNGLKLGGTLVTASATELNILDGGTSATSTTVADADRVVMNDNGTMVQVAVTDLAAYFDDEITAMPNLVTTGALNSGSITSGFGTIDTGSSAITTTGLISGGSLNIGGTNVTSTAGELNLLDGGTSVGSSITIADADGFVVNDGGTMKTIPATDIKTYASGSSATKGFAIAMAIVFG